MYALDKKILKYISLILSIFLISNCSFLNKNNGREIANSSWFAASDNEVINAKCIETLPISSIEIEDYYNSLPELFENNDKFVNGVRFVNERPQLVYAFKNLVNIGPHFYPPKEERAPKDLKTEFNFGSCNKVLCASEIIFGKDVGPQMIYIMDQFGLNTSPYSYANATLFTPNEIKDVLLALRFIPKELKLFKENYKLIKYTRNKIRPGFSNAIIANATIELFDRWNTFSSPMKQYIVFHEFAHVLAKSQLNNLDRSSLWQNIGNWNKSDKELKDHISELDMGIVHVSQYGKTNPVEDFAESVSAYRFNPKHLKKISEEKYNYIKHLLFDGKEFIEEAQCKTPSNLHKIKENINKNLYSFTSHERRSVLSNCQKQAYATALRQDSTASLQSCINYESGLIYYNRLKPEFENLAPHSIFDPRTGFISLNFKEFVRDISYAQAKSISVWISSLLINRNIDFENINSEDEYCKSWNFITNIDFEFSNKTSSWNKIYHRKNLGTKPLERQIQLICKESFKFYNPIIKNNSGYFNKSKIKIDKFQLEKSIEKYVSRRLGTL